MQHISPDGKCFNGEPVEADDPILEDQSVVAEVSSNCNLEYTVMFGV